MSGVNISSYSCSTLFVRIYTWLCHRASEKICNISLWSNPGRQPSSEKIPQKSFLILDSSCFRSQKHLHTFSLKLWALHVLCKLQFFIFNTIHLWVTALHLFHIFKCCRSDIIFDMLFVFLILHRYYSVFITYICFYIRSIFCHKVEEVYLRHKLFGAASKDYFKIAQHSAFQNRFGGIVPVLRARPLLVLLYVHVIFKLGNIFE